jgi:hypothetical protein
MRILERRIERAELAARAQSKFPAECLCFPETEQPVVGFPIELEIAAQVKCPLHDARFKHPRFFIYVSKWLRDKLPLLRLTHHSQQYLKAWHAGFPDQLWPAKEEATRDGLFLVLKDGTKLLATGSLSETNAKGVPH